MTKNREEKMFHWSFPRSIEFWMVPQYLQQSESLGNYDIILFDLSQTETAHSAFIGFLLFMKQRLERNGLSIIVKLSDDMNKIFNMLKIKEHFPPRKEAGLSKRPA